MAIIKPQFGLVNSTLLDKIDRLFACNAGNHVDLPQIVVVGDQSSGKSSVLEGLTNLPFPRDSGLCTRFATQITFRRSSESKISASIIPAKTSDEDRHERLKAWSGTELRSFDPATFARLMAEAISVMGIGAADGQAQRTFSEDVLRLEVSGPNQEHFSVIDVPGIFKRTTQGVTTKEDMSMVNAMVHGYMSNPRSVMLTVVPCNVDIVTQEILERAEELDIDGIRTLGILTKPDIVDKGTEQTVLDLIDGKTHKLRLGWHLLRNPGHAELASQGTSRMSLEQDFFANKAPWRDVDKEKVGISSLRNRLQEILADHIRREFPKVKSELSQKLGIAEEKLQRLGPKRQTERDQRQFLMNIALEFQRLVDFAVGADYSRADFFDQDRSLRLATETVNRGQVFADDMDSHGHKYHFASKDNEISFENDGEAPPIEELAITKKSFTIRKKDGHPDLEDIVFQDVDLAPPHSENILFWLKKEYRDSRGFELGTFDPSLLAAILKRQASKWLDLALGYVSDVVVMVHSFITRVLKQITPNSRVQHGIVSLLMDSLVERYQKAMKHTRLLLHIELEGTPATYNHYFNDQLEKCRHNRLQEHLKGKSFQVSHGEVVRLEDIASNHPLSNSNHTVIDVHDILRAYYKVARKRVVDNVRMQVADYFLVSGADTPLKLFSANFVADATAERLEDIAGEDVIVKRQRAALEQEIKQLQEGRRIIGYGS